MSERLKSYFRHYRSERRGVIVLLIIILLIFGGGELFTHFYRPEPEPFHILLVSEEESNDTKDFEKKEYSSEQGLKPFAFNPNLLSDSGYAEMGFSEREIQTLRKYQAAGGEFRIKSDFAKLFFVDQEEYEMLEPFIDLPEKYSKPEFKQKESFNRYENLSWSDTADTSGYRYEPFICNINTADTNELKRVKGIGSFYANKIVEYREELGGYHTLSQLLELWKMTPEKIDLFADQIKIDKAEIAKIRINAVSAHELSKHPYVSFGLASKIILRREEIGGFESEEHFCESELIDIELCRKLVPYLIFAT